MSKFHTTSVAQIPQGQNRHADSLATLASSVTKNVPRLIKVKLVVEQSIDIAVDVDVTVVSPIEQCWMDQIIDFLVEDWVPNDKKEANKVCRIATRYWLSADRRLYRRSFGGPYLLCLRLEKVNELLAELHDRVCCSHVGGRSLAHQAMTQGFWLP